MFKTTLSSLAAITLLGAAASAMAGPQEQPAAGVVQNDAITVQGGRTSFKPVTQDFAAFTGDFRLENGDILHITQNKKRFYSQINDQAVVEITPRAPGVFITDTGATLRFSAAGENVNVLQPERLAAR